ncbi:MAG: hypothetical protein M0T72_04665, partial [Candidatus Dormibacteraeota bacterium]|nr:hypothetical protein [Candidatus Dormibacteraeota bacterium]
MDSVELQGVAWSGDGCQSRLEAWELGVPGVVGTGLPGCTGLSAARFGAPAADWGWIEPKVVTSGPLASPSAGTGRLEG